VSATPLARRFLNSQEPPFALTAVLDAAGRLARYIFHNHGEALVYDLS